MAKTDITVRELIDKVKRGELALPEMQRRYVWPATRVRDLLDSLYRSYPSGTILVWETDQDVETRELAVKATQSPSTSQKLLLLDGQQRVTSLTAVMSGQHVQVRNRKKPIDILFNLEHPEGPPIEILEVDEEDYSEDIEEVENEEEASIDIQEELKKRTFVVASKTLANNPLWISVSDIFVKSDKELLKPIGINSDDEKWDKYSERLQKVRKIADYPYVMQTLEKSLSYEEVTEIFVRVNSLGIKLRGSDLALAQITSKWKGFIDIVEKFAEEFGQDKDYIIETGLPVRTLVAFATHQSRFKTVGKLSLEKLKSSWETAEEALRFSINFIRSNASIENISMISSPFLLIPIGIYANLNNGSLSKEEEKQLLKWFYIAHMRGHYSMGSSESILDADLSILFKGKGLSGLLTQLEQHVKRFSVESVDIANRSIRSPFFTMLYFVLKEKGAKDWWSGISISEKHVGKAHKLQYHHIFPKSLLKDKNYDKKEINEISNMAFIGGKTNRSITNKEPKIYFESIIEKRGEEALKSQLIPMDKDKWSLDKYRDFLAYRREAIANEINIFMSKFEGENKNA